MNDFISRESAVKAITEYKVTIESENMPEITKCCFQMLNITCDKNIGFINSIPAANVQPVKRGKWIPAGERFPERFALVLFSVNFGLVEEGFYMGAKWKGLASNAIYRNDDITA